MAYEKKEGDISIFKNNFKNATNQPDYKGTYRKNGRDYQVALWIKEDKNGKKFFTGKLSDDEVKAKVADYQPTKSEHSTSDDLPF
jgi:uncharacterized protein (DUF736 family)